MPSASLVTVPAPVPARTTVNTEVGSKVAVMLVAADMVTAQAPIPTQPPPLQPVKTEPEAGLAVRVTAVPLMKVAEQDAPQSMPEGVLITDPAPAPAGGMVNRKVGVKVAVTVVAEETAPPQAPVRVQPPPLQPMKAEPAAGFAVRVTTVPLTKLAEQLAPQAMPAGLLVTVPEAAPAVATVSTKVGVKVAVTVVAAAS